LDGVLADKSYKEIALELYTPTVVKTEWYEGSWLKARIRRRVAKAKHLMDNGYRDFLIN